MEKILVLATFNPHKAEEIRAILPALALELRTLAEFPGAFPAEEDGATLEENARKKALSASRHTGCWALADDTGLEVDALGGAPGVRSARYAGDGASYAENNARLLAALSGVPYDPLFEPLGSALTLAETSGAQKNSLSHRARALLGLLPRLRDII
jgi:XTP/dITP diphosphohydrolase